MKHLHFSSILLSFIAFASCIINRDHDLLNNPNNWSVLDRNVTFENGIAHLDANQGEGLLILKNTTFKNGTIEFDIKGQNIPGKSFVGMAFHYQDRNTFDAVYFRPFNFNNADRKSKSVQYISSPDYHWSDLRKTFPGVFESSMNPLPAQVDDWFNVKIHVAYPMVKVYINGSNEPTLEVTQKSDFKEGGLGFWVGNNSEGWFKNLKINNSK